MTYARRLTILSFIVYSIISFWGVRSPDCEVVFRTTESLATNGSFAVTEELEWQGFGITRGVDGKLYSIFGPGQAIAAVPIYKLAELINLTGWYEEMESLVSKSFNVNKGLTDFILGETPQDREPHALRMIVSILNIIFGSLCVYFFFMTVRVLTKSDESALFTTILFAFGTLIFPYSGSFFSEVMATFFVIYSLYKLLINTESGRSYSEFRPLIAGLSLGIAVSAHLTAVLFVPFFAMYVVFSGRKDPEYSLKNKMLDLTLFGVGVTIILALLAYYNYARFGDLLETGRTVIDASASLGYGVFVEPWNGLQGLMFSAGKGLFLYCPAVIVGIVAWIPFHKKYPVLSITLLGAILFRILFIASRSDWHGGFSLGPRYLVMIIPFFILPIGVLIKDIIARKNFEAVMAFGIFSLITIAQQIYFAIGEIFTFLHIIKLDGLNAGINPFENDAIYLDWNTTPLLYLLNGYRGSQLLNYTDADNYLLWIFMVMIAALMILVLYIYLLKDALSMRRAKLDQINSAQNGDQKAANNRQF